MNKTKITTLCALRDNVLYLRKKLLRVSQSELARHSGVSRDVLWRIENFDSSEEGTSPSLETIITFCDFFGIGVESLLSGRLMSDKEAVKKVLRRREDFLKNKE